MKDDDMSFMDAVFLPMDRERPALPYDEFMILLAKAIGDA